MNASHRYFSPCPSHGFARRSVDLAVATVACAVLAPLMLLIAVALMLESGWPFLFVQTRVGAGGRPFRMYKFRKFAVRCSPNGLPLTVARDSRMTTLGRLLATTKLDELPQLWNVLKGDMAVVGPRPESLAFADCFFGGFETLLQYKPGLLGPAQAIFRHEAYLYPQTMDPVLFYREILFPAKARIDLSYYPKRTIASDVVWMIRCFLAILRAAPAGENF
ncbi:sugar transferase [Mesorhizobium sp. ORS 3428]|uniref:sugar transferase n=1 Tax=Mesorhizobium sp. ORS 3428 TaxID=540997 RepID=UPI0008D92B3A|nr:sugar transferase [Mesorhizobium sp. ORS 3428]OHV88420.1 sugar transferase [Mesorhizobium sp. ORS 3428]